MITDMLYLWFYLYFIMLCCILFVWL